MSRNRQPEPDWAGFFRAVLVSALIGAVIWAGVFAILWAIFH